MLLTMQAAFDEVEAAPSDNIGQIAHAVARGALMGARGNSGVILHKFGGFARALMKTPQWMLNSWAAALQEARDVYKGLFAP